ncbi:MAG: amino acid dehydrogenase, partial [Gammaproteobacteria bacterium]|nr:amino acid dehydrogenase [Gammaproteobacteria bacterium]
VEDIAIIGERTRYVSGVLDSEKYGGDPSPMTAYGVLVGIRQAARYRWQTDLSGIRVAIQGVGNVGYHLARMLVEEGACVTVADIREDNLKRVQSELNVEVVSIDQILSAEVDVLSPCALGGAVSETTVRQVKAGIVAGAANNQLAKASVGRALRDRGILYAPDYVINAGGIIDVYYQRCGERSGDVVNRHIAGIGTTLETVFRLADEQRRPTCQIADEMAEKIFRNAGKEAAQLTQYAYN